MKTNKILLVIPFLLLLTGMNGCEDDKVDLEIQEEEQEVEVYPEAIIVKELPLMTLVSNDSQQPVINSQEELESLFSRDELQKVDDLQQIDFSKYTLLLGHQTFNSTVETMEHSFSKIGEDHYVYTLKVSGYLTDAEDFWYGIIVLKFPKLAPTTFEVKEQAWFKPRSSTGS